MLAPVPEITSNNETANTVFCVFLAIGTSLSLLRPNRTTDNSRERTEKQKAPKPTFAQGIAPWPANPVSLNPLVIPTLPRTLGVVPQILSPRMPHQFGLTAHLTAIRDTERAAHSVALRLESKRNRCVLELIST